MNDDLPEQLYRWQTSRLVEVPLESPAALAAADSFLITGGTLVEWPLHWQRFADSIGQTTTLPAETLTAFRRAVVARLSDFSGFPRLELTAAPQQHLQLRLRAVGPLQTQVHVHIGSPGDPRTHPRIKGPDFAVCTHLIHKAKSADCDEYLIRNHSGLPLECAYSSVVCWDTDTLLVMPRQAPTLPGVTQQALLNLAKQQDIVVRRQPLKTAQLQTLETWLLNARHGIRVVTAWDQAPAPTANEPRLHSFRRQLQNLREPIDKADAKIT